MIAAKKVRAIAASTSAAELGDEVEFTTIMRFNSLDAVKLSRADYERSFVPPQAHAVLSASTSGSALRPRPHIDYAEERHG